MVGAGRAVDQSVVAGCGANGALPNPVLSLLAGVRCVVVWRFLLGCGGAVLAWRGVSRLVFVVASHAVLSWRAGEGGCLILPALAKSAPTLPSPPRHPVTARCAACGGADEECGVSFSPFWCGHAVTRLRRQRVKKPWIETAGAHGFARARGEPFRQSLLAACGGRLTPCPGAERSNATHAWQSPTNQHHFHQGTGNAPTTQPITTRQITVLPSCRISAAKWCRRSQGQKR